MKLLFVRPRMHSSIEKEEPLGLLYLISYLQQRIKKVKIDFIDAHVLRLSPENIYEKIIQEKYNLVLVSVLTIAAPFSYKLAKLIKRGPLKRFTTVIFGGPHASGLPEECLLNGADFCVIGEGEVVLCNLINAITTCGDLSNVKGIVYFERNGSLKFNPLQDLIPNLSELQYPALRLTKNMKYETTIHMHIGNKAFPIIASRGCKYNCPFCCSKLMWRRNVRYRGVKNVVDELSYHYKFDNVNEFHFYDDDFLMNRSFIHGFAKEIIKRQLEIRYTCLSTYKSFLEMDDEDLMSLKKSGLSLIEFGIESLIPSVLKNIGKSYRIEEIFSLIDKLLLNSINAYPLLMFMIPGETLQSHLSQAELFNETFGQIPYVRTEYEIRPDIFIAKAATYTPFPGTLFWKNIDKQGVLLTKRWDYFNTELITFIPRSLLEDIPIKNASNIDSATVKRLKLFCKHKIIENVSPKIDDFVELLWELIDGRNNLFSIAEMIYKMENRMSWETSLAFTTIAMLTLLLNKNLIVPVNKKKRFRN